ASNHIPCSYVPSLEEKIKSAMKMSSWRIAEQFREASPYRPMIENAKMLKANAKRQCTRPKGGSPGGSMISTNFPSDPLQYKLSTTINTYLNRFWETLFLSLKVLKVLSPRY
ncbi:hypothetical protein H5410_031986, partial [Solanum commersonii]